MDPGAPFAATPELAAALWPPPTPPVPPVILIVPGPENVRLPLLVMAMPPTRPGAVPVAFPPVFPRVPPVFVPVLAVTVKVAPALTHMFTFPDTVTFEKLCDPVIE